MIKLFRKARYDLMKKKPPAERAVKTGKYMKYAIGEIILVVIGILIALQINNWSEQKKMDLEEKVLLSGLINDIDQDIINLKGFIKGDSLYLSANRVLLDAFKHDSIRENKELLKHNTLYASGFASFSPSKTMFNLMVTSGKINYIAADSLRNKIQKYYDNIKEVMSILKSNERLMFDLSISSLQYVDINSSFQLALPEYAKLELDEFDNSFFYEPIGSAKVKKFANLVTTRQYLMSNIDFGYARTILDGSILKQNLIEYLDTK